MICKRIEYKNFRNCERAVIEPDPCVTVLNGENGQGKTNFLEGVYLCASGKSFRTVHENELVRFGCDFGQVEMTFFDGKRDNRISFRLVPKMNKRFCRINDVPITKLSEIVGRFRAVLFCPEHLSIVKDGPSVRRRFIDLALSQTDNDYLRSLQKYNSLLSQRNALIKMARDRRDDGLFLNGERAWSEQLAVEAEIISNKRLGYIERLSTLVNNITSDMTAEAEKTCLTYQTPRTKEEYLSLLTENLERELHFGATLFGVHKDDISISLNGKEARSFASQGQQRTIALATKIAEGEISKEISGSYPVFLFDDILSELDDKRKDYLISGMGDRQVIITSCNRIDTPCKLYVVKNGTVKESTEHLK